MKQHKELMDKIIGANSTGLDRQNHRKEGDGDSCA